MSSSTPFPFLPAPASAPESSGIPRLPSQPRDSRTFPQRYIYQVPRGHFRRLLTINGPHRQAHRRVVKRLWEEGSRRGISATEMSRVRLPGSEAKLSQNKEGFRNRNPPPLDRRGGLGGELFVFFFSFLFSSPFYSWATTTLSPAPLTACP